MKITVITVIYNGAETIEDTIKSVLSQTYKDIEYIVVDGGSTDGTVDIIRRYEPRFEGRMKWVSERDNGLYDAINKGIRMATGNVVGILNSDDYYTSDHVLEKIAPFFKGNTIDAVYGDIHFIHPNNPDKCVRYYSSRPFKPFWLRFGFMPAHPSFYVRRSVYQKVGGYKTDYKIGSDFEMMVRLFRKFHIKSKYVKMDFVTMRTGGLSTRNIRSRLTLINEDVRACRENGIYTNKLLVYTKFIYKIFEFL